MKFRVTTSNHFYDPIDQKKHIENLKELGFKFYTNDNAYKSGCLLIDWNHTVYIDITSLDELMKLSRKLGDIIISVDIPSIDLTVEDCNEIEVYDGYRE